MSEPTYLEIERGKEFLAKAHEHVASMVPERHQPRLLQFADEGFESLDDGLIALSLELHDHGQEADALKVESALSWWENFCKVLKADAGQ